MSDLKVPYGGAWDVDLPQGSERVAFEFWGAPVIKDARGTLSCPGYIGNTFFPEQAYSYLRISLPLPYRVGSLSSVEAFPGLCDVQVDVKRDKDQKKSAGSDGARLTLTGRAPAEVEVRCVIWTPEQLRILREMWRVIQPLAGKGTPSPYDVGHPVFDFHGVKSIQFLSASGPMQGGPPGSRVFVFKALEYLPPLKKNATTTPDKSKAKGAVARGSALDPEYQPPGKNPSNTGPT